MCAGSCALAARGVRLVTEIDMRQFPVLVLLATVAPAAVLAHHGWGSYDASKLMIVEGPIQALSYVNLHGALPAGAPLPARARLAAVVSLAIWLSVAACGRLIAYF
jgi:hypothetical protein